MMATRCSAWPPAPCRRRMTRWKWWRPNSWRGRSRTGYARPWHNRWSAAGGDRLGLPIRDIELEPDAEALVAVRLPRGAPATRQVVDETNPHFRAHRDLSRPPAGPPPAHMPGQEPAQSRQPEALALALGVGHAVGVDDQRLVVRHRRSPVAGAAGALRACRRPCLRRRPDSHRGCDSEDRR